MAFVHHIFIQKPAQLLQSKNHIVDFHTIYKLSIIPQFCLNSVKLGIKLLKVRELKENFKMRFFSYCFEVDCLDVLSDMIVKVQKFHNG